TSRLQLNQILLFGLADRDLNSPRNLQALDFSAFLSFTGGLALRLVSAPGLLISVPVLVASWSFRQREEVLVTLFAAYYFVVTAYVSFSLPSPPMRITSGIFLNAFWLALVVYLGLVGKNPAGPPQLFLALVFTGLWVLFVWDDLRCTLNRQSVRKSIF